VRGRSAASGQALSSVVALQRLLNGDAFIRVQNLTTVRQNARDRRLDELQRCDAL
jgi:hypothetical protein